MKWSLHVVWQVYGTSNLHDHVNLVWKIRFVKLYQARVIEVDWGVGRQYSGVDDVALQIKDLEAVALAGHDLQFNYQEAELWNKCKSGPSHSDVANVCHPSKNLAAGLEAWVGHVRNDHSDLRKDREEFLIGELDAHSSLGFGWGCEGIFVYS